MEKFNSEKALEKAINLLNEVWLDYITYKDNKYLFQYKSMIKPIL